MIALLLKAGKRTILLGTFLLIALTCAMDVAVGHNVSLAPLYILPMMSAAVVLRPAQTAVLAIVCSWLRACFDTPGSAAELTLRFVFAALAYFLSGLFVTELVRKHEMVTRHLETLETEQAFRRQAEDQLRFLVESSPAAILTVDEEGIVLAANDAANHLLLTGGSGLEGRWIGRHLPVLTEVLKTEVGRDGLRTAAQCQGQKEDGEIFAADAWFSSYSSPHGTRLAAIVVDSSDELRAREEQGLRESLQTNRIIAAAFSHEVRNFCVAMNMLCASLRERELFRTEPDLKAMADLLESMQSVATAQLQNRRPEALEKVALRDVLDKLRIVVDPQWQDIGGTVVWSVPAGIPRVMANPHGLLQTFLNLTQNSLRAVREVGERLLKIEVGESEAGVRVTFRDSGPGIADPRHLFQALQPSATGSGLGLYVSRSIVRSYGGDLRYEGQAGHGAVFVVDLQTV